MLLAHVRGPPRGMSVCAGDVNRNADDETPGTAQHAAELLAQVEGMLGCFPDGVLLYDSQGRIVRSNGRADAILGYTPGEQESPAAERLAHGSEWLAEDGTRMSFDDLPARLLGANA